MAQAASTAPAAAPVTSEEDTGVEIKRHHLGEILEPLQKIPEAQRTYCCRKLLECVRHQQAFLSILVKATQSEELTLAECTKAVLHFLKAYIDGTTGFPRIAGSDMFELEVVASGIAQPFVTLTPSGGAEFGIPQHEDALCDNAAELSRVAAAAVVAYFVYLNFSMEAGEDSLAADESMFRFTAIAIRSLLDAPACERIDAELAELGVGITTHDIRWLMHYLQAEVLGYMSQVHGVFEDEETQAYYLGLQQKEFAHCIKVLPDNPLPYGRYAQICMQFQKMGVAHAFVTKGLAMAAAAGDDDFYTSQLKPQQVCCVLLGGKGETFNAAEVEALLHQGQAAQVRALAWLPDLWEAAVTESKHAKIVNDLVIPEILKRDKKQKLEGEAVPALKAIYATPKVDQLPPGALTKDGSGSGAGSSSGGGQAGQKGKGGGKKKK